MNGLLTMAVLQMWLKHQTWPFYEGHICSDISAAPQSSMYGLLQQQSMDCF